MSDKDYRNTPYCESLVEVSDKKSELKKQILTEHSRTRNFYNSIKPKSSKYNREFAKIYNHKCAYCGVSVAIIPIELFEIDHYMCENSFKTKIEAGEINNLVYSCKNCNRSKSSYEIPHTHTSVLHPDDTNVVAVFERDKDYRIVISDQYRGDDVVEKYYNKLKLGDELRRLDFLLMNILGLYNKIKAEPEAKELYDVIELFRKKRNLSILT